MSINVKPLADRVIIEPSPAEEKTTGGIIIPDTAKEKPKKGKVIAAGSGKKDEPVTVKEGDTVLYGQYSGTEIKIVDELDTLPLQKRNFWLMGESLGEQTG